MPALRGGRPILLGLGAAFVVFIGCSKSLEANAFFPLPFFLKRNAACIKKKLRVDFYKKSILHSFFPNILGCLFPSAWIWSKTDQKNTLELTKSHLKIHNSQRTKNKKTNH